jgi:hypothetical protein
MAKKKTAQTAAVLQMVRDLTGAAPAPEYVGKKVWSRKTKGERQKCGTVTATARCQMEGCNGVRLYVRWRDGHQTRPCSKGCEARANGDLEIR